MENLLLQESADHLLLEIGEAILLEDSTANILLTHPWWIQKNFKKFVVENPSQPVSLPKRTEKKLGQVVQLSDSRSSVDR